MTGKVTTRLNGQLERMVPDSTWMITLKSALFPRCNARRARMNYFSAITRTS